MSITIITSLDQLKPSLKGLLALNLSNKGLVDADVKPLQEKVQVTPNLTSIDISQNKVGGLGASAMISASAVNPSITHLNLKNVGLTPILINELWKNMRKNYALLKVEIEEDVVPAKDAAIESMYGAGGEDFDINVLKTKISRICESNVSLNKMKKGETVDLTLKSRFLEYSELPFEIFTLYQPQTVDFTNNFLPTTPPELKSWSSSLQSFSADNCKLQSIDFSLGTVFQLKNLSLKNNEISVIPDSLGLLTNLTSLNVSKNKLKTIPQVLGSMKELKTLDVSNNPLNSKECEIPKEVIKAGNESILGYLKDITASGEEKVYRMKLMFVGNGNVGKTSLLSCFVSQNKKELKKKQDSPNVATDGIDVTDWVIPGAIKNNDLVFSCWDFAGQEVYYSTHQFFLSSRSIFLLVFNMLQDEEYSRVEYWLNTVTVRAKNAPVILVGTHYDDKKCSKKYVESYFETLLEKYSKKFPNIVFHTPVSTSTSKNIDTLKAKLIKIATSQPTMGESIPKSWLSLEAKVKSIKIFNQQPIIQFRTYKKLVVDSGIPEARIPQVTQFLHDLGVLVHFRESDGGLNEIVILDPQWLTKVFATLITMKPNSVKSGIIMKADLHHIWKPPEFPPERHPFLLALLSKFEILFMFSKSEQILVPSLLNDNVPKQSEIDKFWSPKEGTETEISRSYKFDFLPHGFFGRMIIRMLHSDWDAVLYWKAGLICHKPPDKRLIVTIDFTNFEMVFKLRGSKLEKEVLPISQSIESLISDWLNVKVIITIPCPSCQLNGGKESFLIGEIETLLAKGGTRVSCKNGHDVELSKIAPDIALSDLQVPKVNYEDLNDMKQIGEGGFALVYKAVWNGKKVAVKQMTLERMDDFTCEPVSVLQIFSEFRREVWLMSFIRHPKLVQLHGICMEPFCMIMEFMDAGSLYDYVRNPITWTEKFLLALDVAQGMEYLHACIPPLIHRDLKSPNVLMQSQSDRKVAKVADFGLSRALEFAPQISGKVVDNPIWLPPEILEKKSYDEKVDVYAFGVIMWEIASGQDFFGDITFMAELEKMIIKGDRPPIPPETPELFSQMIVDCWNGDPRKRPSFSKCVQKIEKHIDPSKPAVLHRHSTTPELEVEPVKKNKKGDRSATSSSLPRHKS